MASATRSKTVGWKPSAFLSLPTRAPRRYKKAVQAKRSAADNTVASSENIPSPTITPSFIPTPTVEQISSATPKRKLDTRTIEDMQDAGHSRVLKKPRTQEKALGVEKRKRSLEKEGDEEEQTEEVARKIKKNRLAKGPAVEKRKRVLDEEEEEGYEDDKPTRKIKKLMRRTTTDVAAQNGGESSSALVSAALMYPYIDWFLAVLTMTLYLRCPGSDSLCCSSLW